MKKESVNLKWGGKYFVALAVMAIMLFAMTITARATGSVANLTQTDASRSSVTVSWTAVYGEYYKVLVSSSRDGGYSYASNYSSSNDSKYIYSLNAGSTYYVKVETYTSSSYNATAVAVSAPIEVVTAPDNVNSTTIKQTGATSTSLSVAWTGTAGATGYKVSTYINSSTLSSTQNVTTAGATLPAKAGEDYIVWINAYRQSSAGYVAYSTSGNGTARSSYVYSAPVGPSNFAKASKSYIEWYPTKSNKVTLRWDSKSNYYSPDGYQLEIYNVSGKKKLATYSVTSKYKKITSSKVCKAIKNKGFKVRIRSYKKNDGVTFYSSWSKLKTIIPEAKISGKRVGSSSTVRITWPKVSNATKYIVYYTKNYKTSGKNKFKKKVVSKNTRTFDLTGLSSANKVGAYVIPVVKVKGKTYKASYTWNYYWYTY